MLEVSQSSREYAITTPAFQLIFEHVGDRWQHRVLFSDGQSPQPVLISAEGTPAQTQPASPAFQDLRLEQVGEEQQEFQLMGQSGKQIYSAAIRVDGRRNLVDFDICTRFQKMDSAAEAFSTYRIEPGIAADFLEENGATTLRVSRAAMGLLIAAQSISGQPPSRIERISDGNPVTFRIVGQKQPVGPGSRPSQTLRWRYQISGVPSA